MLIVYISSRAISAWPNKNEMFVPACLDDVGQMCPEEVGDFDDSCELPQRDEGVGQSASSVSDSVSVFISLSDPLTVVTAVDLLSHRY